MTTLWICCATALMGTWPTYHGDADLRGVATVALPEQPELLWRYNAGGAVSSTPVSDGERIFFTAKKGRVVALDLTGGLAWEKSFSRTNSTGQVVEERFDAPLACGGGRVFAGSSRGTLFALDAASGETAWRYETGGILVGSPNRLDTNTLVVLDQSEGALHAVEMGTGQRRWKTDGVERCDGSPGIGNGRIVFGSCLAALHCYSTEGRHLNDIEVGGDGQIAGGVALEGNQAFFGTRDGRLLCVDVAKDEILWSRGESQDQTFATPVVTEALVVYSSDDGFVRAVGKSTGEVVWAFDTGGLPTSPVVAADKVAVAADGTLYLLRLADGTKLWSKAVGDEISSPALIGGMVVVGSDDGTVSAFGAKM